ncbi:MAG: hypothetical protein AAF533_00360 [Acidobacteriota bacterium]
MGGEGREDTGLTLPVYRAGLQWRSPWVLLTFLAPFYAVALIAKPGGLAEALLVPAMLLFCVLLPLNASLLARWPIGWLRLTPEGWCFRPRGMSWSETRADGLVHGGVEQHALAERTGQVGLGSGWLPHVAEHALRVRRLGEVCLRTETLVEEEALRAWLTGRDVELPALAGFAKPIGRRSWVLRVSEEEERVEWKTGAWRWHDLVLAVIGVGLLVSVGLGSWWPVAWTAAVVTVLSWWKPAKGGQVTARPTRLERSALFGLRWTTATGKQQTLTGARPDELDAIEAAMRRTWPTLDPPMRAGAEREDVLPSWRESDETGVASKEEAERLVLTTGACLRPSGFWWLLGLLAGATAIVALFSSLIASILSVLALLLLLAEWSPDSTGRIELGEKGWRVRDGGRWSSWRSDGFVHVGFEQHGPFELGTAWRPHLAGHEVFLEGRRVLLHTSTEGEERRLRAWLRAREVELPEHAPPTGTIGRRQWLLGVHQADDETRVEWQTGAWLQHRRRLGWLIVLGSLALAVELFDVGISLLPLWGLVPLMALLHHWRSMGRLHVKTGRVEIAPVGELARPVSLAREGGSLRLRSAGLAPIERIVVRGADEDELDVIERELRRALPELSEESATSEDAARG